MTDAMGIHEAAEAISRMDGLMGALTGEPVESKEEAEAPEAEAPEPEAKETEPQKAEAAEAPAEGEADKEATEAKEESESTEPAEKPKAYKVNVNGQEMEVDEKELLQGYQRQADYTRKTQEVAAKEREVSAKAEALESQYGTTIETLLAVAQEALGVTGAPDISLLDSDPVAYMKAKEQHERFQSLISGIAQQREVEKQRADYEFQQRTQAQIHEEHRALLDKLPEWRDPNKAKAEKAELTNYLTKNGYPPEMVNSIARAQDVVIARKAMLYDKLMASKTEVKAKLEKAPVKVEKPGTKASNQTGRTGELESRFRRSGKIDDLASLLAARL